jgi:hypothetical protein
MRIRELVEFGCLGNVLDFEAGLKRAKTELSNSVEKNEDDELIEEKK